MILASPYTQIFWNEYQINQLRSDYHIVFDNVITGKLDIDRLALSLHQLIDHYILLNSHLVFNQGRLFWQQNNTIVPLIELNNDQKVIEKFIDQPFFLDKGPLYRFGIVSLDHNQYRFIAIFHHALIDGTHIDRFITLVTDGYNNSSVPKANVEDQISILNATHQKQHDYVAALNQAGSREIWRDYLAGSVLNNALPYIKSNRNHMVIKAFTMPVADIHQRSEALSISDFNILLLSWGVLISKYCASELSYINYPVKIKTDEDIFFGAGINVNIAKIFYEKSDTFKDIVSKHQQMLAILADNKNKHSYLPIADIVKSSSIQHLNVGFANTNLRKLPFDFKDCQSRSLTQHYVDMAGCDILLEYQRINSAYCFRLKYNGALFSDQQIKAMTIHYQTLVSEFLQYPNKPVSQVSLLDTAEYNKVVHRWNQTDSTFPKDKTLHQLFEAEAAKAPDNVALICDGQSLTYEELNQKSNQLARAIQAQYLNTTGSKLKPDTPLALYLERSLEMIISILAVLKAGGAYVPIDTELPNGRIAYILQDSQSQLLLTQSRFKKKLTECFNHIDYLWVDSPDCYHFADDNLNDPVRPDHLAYIMYTSGTTGQPKGVMVAHGSIVNTVVSLFSVYQLQPSDNVTVFAAYVFDVFAAEIWVTLFQGARGHLLTDAVRQNVDKLSDYFIKHSIYYAFIPPAILSLLPQNKNYAFKGIIFAGEPCAFQTGLYWSKAYRLFNYYGPTEAAIYASGRLVSDQNINSIGRPINNTKLYIVDKYMQTVPIGVIGELCISGAGLARGYLNQPGLTKACFINNPFASKQDMKNGYSRLYKTGDLCRFLPDGNIEYIDRNDSQVKLRGIRVEIGEIESALNQINGIEQSIVIAEKRTIQGRQATVLIAYYVASSELSETFMTGELLKTLPNYMLPVHFMRLEALPLTRSGKIDRLALPKFDSFLAETYTLPSNDIEAKLCGIWSTLFNVPSSQVSVDQGFFSCGGNSIIAIEMTMQIKQLFNKEITVADIFKHQTIQAIANNIIQQEEKVAFIEKHTTKQALLSSQQQALWFIETSESSGAAYHIPIEFILADNICIEAVEKALAFIVKRHEVLHSVITVDASGNCEQRPISSTLTIEKHHCSNNSNYKNKREKFIHTAFDLCQLLPIRIGLFSVAAKAPRHYLVINFHHIAFDGWSIGIFLRELETSYLAYVCQKTPNLSPLPFQYKDYALWQQRYLSSHQFKEKLDYWCGQLIGFEPLNLITDQPRPATIDYHGDNIYFQLNTKLSDQLRQLAAQQGVSLYSLLLSAFYILLYKYSSQADIVIGTPMANRQFSEFRETIGCFVNSVALRHRINTDSSVKDFIAEIARQVTSAQAHEDVPFEQVVKQLNIKPCADMHPIFQVFFSVQDFESINSDCPVGQWSITHDALAIAKFDLSLFINDAKAHLQGHINYASALFEKNTIKRMCKHYQCILERLVKSTDAIIGEISLLDAREYQKIVDDWNQTDKAFSKDKTLPQLFEAQAAKTPNNIALIFEGQSMTYQELNQKSNQLAWVILAQCLDNTHSKLQPDTLIALYLQRSFDMVISILAVLKAGGAYVPIDPEFPKERINYILQDTGAKIILTQSRLIDHLNQLSRRMNCIAVDQYNLKNIKSSNLPQYSQPNNLAYVIYTSGTTGQPKGVCLPHQGIVNRIEWMQSEYQLNLNDRILQKTPFTFDVSVWELLWANCYGAAIVLARPNGHKDLDYLYNLIEKEKITITHFVPSMLDTLLENLSLSNRYLNPSLRYIFSSGEVLKEKTVNNCYELAKHDHFALHNLYGPTEASIDVTHTPCYKSKQVNIGSAIQNTRIYILDNKLSPMPIGLVGELYIGGAGLARGYLNQPELTEAQFITNPFASKKDIKNGYTRLYKTGDLCRFLADGNIEYIGRNDFQVKISGFRIELNEIEKAISKINGIKQACVIAKSRTFGSHTQQYLAAFYVLDSSLRQSQENKANKKAKITTGFLIEQLKKKLPNYMIPSSWTELEALPLTANGKLDRKALSNIVLNFSGIAQHKLRATGDLVQQLTQVYAEVLAIDIDKIAIEASFFDLGGSSLLMMQLKHRLMAIDECKGLTVTDLFTYPSIQALINYLQKTPVSDHQDNSKKVLNRQENIAVIALSGAFSGSDNLQHFWQMISQNLSGLTRFDIEYCRQQGVAEEALYNPDYIPVSGHISNIDYFDPAFWGISAHDAKLLDPQIRKFVEHCWYVLDSAGYAKERKRLKIDIVAGSGNAHYLYDNILHSKAADQLNLWEASVANSKDALATKASYLLGLKGAATSINTACSTGLVTIVEACRKLGDGLCDMAIAGSVSLLLPHQIGYVYREGMIMSKDGHCRTFDADASGTVTGSGVGAVLLKRLSDAEKDQDNIIGVIAGYATNNDGDRKVSYTAPSVEGQRECIEEAIQAAGIASEMLDYIECHGTATVLGDPIEIRALDSAFKNTATVKRETPCYLGAVKANIGHTDSAAGFAGFAKVCLMLQHKKIPAQVDYDRPNPEIGIENTPFTINRQHCDWQSHHEKPRYAGVSSFGIGGTNAHIILREYQPEPIIHDNEQDQQISYILPLSAKSHQALQDYKTAFIVYLAETKTPFKDILYTLQARKSFFTHRLAVACSNKTEAIKKLEGAEIINANSTINSPIKTVFMFPGQGMQYSDMTVSLYQQDRDYQDYVDQCIYLIESYGYQAAEFRKILFPSLYNKNKVLKNINNDLLIDHTKWSQLALFVVSFSLAKLLQKLGIKPDILIGHSIGEYVAATLSGVFTLEDAIKLIFKRATLMQHMPFGAMLSVQASADEIMPLAKEYQCELAVINSPNHCVLSGDIPSIAHLKTRFDYKDIVAVILKTSHAYHSKMMDSAAIEYIHIINSVKLQQPSIPFVSNISGDWADKSALDFMYWSDHIRKPVKFSQGIATILHHHPNALFIEVGPGNSLSNFVTQHKNEYQKPPTVMDLIPSAKLAAANQHIPNTQTDLLARLWCLGYPLKFSTIENPAIAALPPYQFDYQSCWVRPLESYNRQAHKLSLLPQKYWLNKVVWKQFGKLNSLFPGILKDKHALVITTETTPESLLRFSFKSTIILKLTNAVEGFKAVNKYQLFCNIASEKAYEALSQYLQAKEIDCVVDCTTLTREYCFTSGVLDQCLENGFYALFLVQKYLLCQCTIQHYFLLTQGIAQIEKEDKVDPANGSLIGAIRVLRHEMPHIQFSMVDVGYGEALSLDGVINHIFSGSINPSGFPYAVRGNGLWIEAIETIEEGNSQGQHLIRCDDVILITGGLGGMGLSVADYISQKNKVHFILTSRTSSLSAKQSDIIKQIRDNHCTVEIHSGDVSNEEFIRTLISNIEKKYQKLSGVIHLAGSPPLSPEDKSIENVKQAVAAKVYGISYILKFIDKENLRYFIMASSLASIMGDVHRIEYCAANSYLDYQVRLMNDALPFCQSLSINWLGWRKVGMAVAEEPVPRQNKLIDLNSVTAEEGSKLFYDLMKPAICNQVIVSKFNIPKLKEKFFHRHCDQKATDISDKLLEKNVSKACYDIARLCLSVLEVDQISIHDDLFNLGLSSLDAIRLLSALKEIGIFISIQQLFELNSIDKIYSHHLSSTKINNIIQKSGSASERSLLLLRQSSNKAIGNIFFIHPVGGILVIYNSLIAQLSKRYNYYGLQNINLYHYKKFNFKSFEALAEYYLNEILTIQSTGEYILIGSSLGGALAYEIARQLEVSGRKVKFIAMIDAWAYFAKVFYSRANFESNIGEQIKNQEIFGSLSGVDKQVFMDEGWKIMQLNLDYQPKASHSPIYLYKASILDKYYIHNGVCADNGWQQYTDCKMKIYYIPGDHVSIHNNVNLSIMAKHLNQALDSVDNKQELLLV